MIQVRKKPPLYLLDESNIFPDPNKLGDEDLVAVGGDFSSDRLISAYKSGIFPWFIEEGLIYWFSPNPRTIILPGTLRVSKSLSKTIKKNKFKIKYDNNFEGVIKKCASVKRKEESGTWISDEFIDGFVKLHNKGVAHSIECYLEDRLVGGLYGLIIGNAFFGESMFSEVSDSSKVALFYLDRMAQEKNFHFIDCQVHTKHLQSLGAIDMERSVYLNMLKKAI